jgi:hypothetical protein
LNENQRHHFSFCICPLNAAGSIRKCIQHWLKAYVRKAAPPLRNAAAFARCSNPKFRFVHLYVLNFGTPGSVISITEKAIEIEALFKMMNDLVLSEDGHAMPADEYHDNEDYYETQTGEDITGARRMRPRRGNYGKYMVVFGGILILGGIILGFAGGDIDAIKAHNDLKNQLNPPTPSPRPPTAAPTMAPTSFEDGVLDILTQSVDKKVLLDDDSYAFNAYTWLMKNADIRQYSTNQIRQRFALASIYYGTNEDLLSWKKDDSWITDSDECSWFGVKCDKEGKGHIVALNLTGNGLQGNFPNEITMLKNHLMSLEIGINNLFNHGKDLAWMADLKELSK